MIVIDEAYVEFVSDTDRITRSGGRVRAAECRGAADLLQGVWACGVPGRLLHGRC